MNNTGTAEPSIGITIDDYTKPDVNRHKNRKVGERKRMRRKRKAKKP